MRRPGLALLVLLAGCAGGGPAPEPPPATAAAVPNVLVILTDDQGYPDLGCHGARDLKTPRLDAFAKESVQVERFYVAPVCSPTRASLLTGRWNYRTGVVDTFIGRSLMHADEFTLAEALQGTHRTGIFGKWHLGDNHPLRARDQGFERTLTLKGGGIGQPSDPPGGDHYQNPTLYVQGRPVKMNGYVTDLITDGALEFIRDSDRPFFAWVAYNAPHTPLEPPPTAVLNPGLPDALAKIYAMIENIDLNVGRLLDGLRSGGKERDTIVVFLTDNGPQQARPNATLRGLKGSLFEGGIRVPFYIRWPARLKGGRSVPGPGAHVDLMPTILEACGLPLPADVRIDGLSLLPHLEGRDLPDRRLFLQWHRGEVPEPRRSFAVVTRRWKLVGNQPKDPPMLFDLVQDPAEKTDLSASSPDVLQDLLAAYDDWFRDVSHPRRFAPPRLQICSDSENPTVLTRQDWRGPQAGWGRDSQGYWEIEATRSLRLKVTLRFRPFPTDGSALVRVGSQKASALVRAGQTYAVLDLSIRSGNSRLEALLSSGAQRFGPDHVELLRVD